MTSQATLDRHRLRSTRVRRFATLLPVGLASLSWTVAVAGAGLTPAPASDGRRQTLPAVSVPERAVEVPASVSGSDEQSTRAVSAAGFLQMGSELIPAQALSAYRRAAAIIGGADRTCGLRWPILAAIGKIESNHGRVKGSQLGADGIASPRILGAALKGSGATARISDTDGGQLDGDGAWDRAVGPMQIIPSTWMVVGVDADGDGQRNPQDIDDAALAAAVYLCSGGEDLTTPAGQRTAVLRYNHSTEYSEAVLATADSYAAAGLVPAAAGVAVAPAPAAFLAARDGREDVRKPELKGAIPAAPSVKSGDPRTGTPTGEEPAVPSDQPPPAAPLKPVETLLTTAQAVLACALTGINQLLESDRFSDCVEDRSS